MEQKWLCEKRNFFPKTNYLSLDWILNIGSENKRNIFIHERFYCEIVFVVYAQKNYGTRR